MSAVLQPELGRATPAVLQAREGEVEVGGGGGWGSGVLLR
jgi:hypothetical protein